MTMLLYNLTDKDYGYDDYRLLNLTSYDDNADGTASSHGNEKKGGGSKTVNLQVSDGNGNSK